MMTNTTDQSVTRFQAGKQGFLVGFAISATPILYGIFTIRDGPTPDPMFSAFAFIFPLLFGGGLSGFIVEAVIIRKWIHGNEHLRYKKGIIGGTIVGSLLALPIALYSGFILGAPIANALLRTDHPSSPVSFTLASGVATLLITITMVSLISSFVTLCGIAVQGLIRVVTRIIHGTVA